jgi:peptidoglycan/xylan/chitin deacetylase (PgdA/CDA1 family)
MRNQLHIWPRPDVFPTDICLVGCGTQLAYQRGMSLLNAAIPIVKTAAIRSHLFQLAARVTGRRIAILRYHSVLPRPADFSDSIGPSIIHSCEAFSEQMDFVASRYHPVTLDDICAYLKGEAELPNRSIAVTFDDGFADNLEYAAPILARAGIPAAIYLAADYIGNQSQPWYCRLRYAFAVSSNRNWKASNDVVFDMSLPDQRWEAYLDSARICAQLCGHAQEEFVTQAETKLEVTPFAIPVMLTWEGARELVRQGHIIGSHTLSHPNVAYLSEQNMKNELVFSKEVIEKNTLTEIKHFSYPSPILEPHHSQETIAVAKLAGYQSAVTCDRGAIEQGDNCLSLRRIGAPPTLAELEWKLENGFAGRIV